MTQSCTAFAGSRRIASGDLVEVTAQVKKWMKAEPEAQILVFDDKISEIVELDPLPTVESPEATARKAGRPRLGVVAREVTLLPRHWEWLSSQPGGASVAIRKLVEQARTANVEIDRHRVARESAYRFMSAMAGNEPGFEEGSRALFAGSWDEFDRQMALWPPDVREHAAKLTAEIR